MRGVGYARVGYARVYCSAEPYVYIRLCCSVVLRSQGRAGSQPSSLVYTGIYTRSPFYSVGRVWTVSLHKSSQTVHQLHRKLVRIRRRKPSTFPGQNGFSAILFRILKILGNDYHKPPCNP